MLATLGVRLDLGRIRPKLVSVQWSKVGRVRPDFDPGPAADGHEGCPRPPLSPCARERSARAACASGGRHLRQAAHVRRMTKGPSHGKRGTGDVQHFEVFARISDCDEANLGGHGGWEVRWRDPSRRAMAAGPHFHTDVCLRLDFPGSFDTSCRPCMRRLPRERSSFSLPYLSESVGVCLVELRLGAVLDQLLAASLVCRLGARGEVTRNPEGRLLGIPYPEIGASDLGEFRCHRRKLSGDSTVDLPRLPRSVPTSQALLVEGVWGCGGTL